MKVEYIENLDEDSLISWAAGILEGEGCFSLHTRNKGKRGRIEFAIHCEMTDQDTIEKLRKVLGVGNISYRENKRSDGKIRKPSWILSIQKQIDIFNTLIKVLPYLSKRRLEKAQIMFEALLPKIVK